MVSWRHKPGSIKSQWLAFRQAGAGYPALWLPGSKRDPTPQPAGRWHDEGENYAQYLSLSSDGAWAELIRHSGTRIEENLRKFRHNLWSFEVTEESIADLDSFEKAEKCGLDPVILIEDDLKRCQALARNLRRAGYRGILTRSAAVPAGRNLTLFGPRREDEVHFRALGSFERHNLRPDFFITTAKLVDRGSPPAHLLSYVRYQGDLHLGYEAWQRRRSQVQLTS